MKKRKNTVAQIVAIIALLAIILGIIGTGILVVASSLGWQNNYEVWAHEQQEILDSLSGATSLDIITPETN